jgi:hypothetical protein
MTTSLSVVPRTAPDGALSQNLPKMGSLFEGKIAQKTSASQTLA